MLTDLLIFAKGIFARGKLPAHILGLAECSSLPLIGLKKPTDGLLNALEINESAFKHRF